MILSYWLQRRKEDEIERDVGLFRYFLAFGTFLFYHVARYIMENRRTLSYHLKTKVERKRRIRKYMCRISRRRCHRSIVSLCPRRSFAFLAILVSSDSFRHACFQSVLCETSLVNISSWLWWLIFITISRSFLVAVIVRTAGRVLQRFCLHRVNRWRWNERAKWFL